MLINKSTLTNLFITLSTAFNKALKGSDTVWQKIALRIPSTGSSNDYSWLSRFPKMREWVGDKVIKSLEGFNYTIPNKSFEATVAVRRDDIEDDQTGMYGSQAAEAGYSAASFVDELIFDLINKCFTEKCYDGQYFCDTDHPVGSGTVSNKGTAVLSASTQALAKASLGAARTAMRKFKDDEGRPLGIRPNILLVPPALEDVALTLANAERLEDGKPNLYKGTVEVVIGDWLTSDTAWFLLDTNRAIKPFIYQDRKSPLFVSQTDASSDSVFTRGEFLYSAEARGNAGFGLWQLCYGSTGA